MVKTTSRRHVSWLFYLLIVLAIMVIVGVLYVLHVGPFKHKTPATTASQYTKGEPTGSSSSNSNHTTNSTSSSTNTNPKNTAGGNSGATGTPPVTPSGDFVSDHRPNLSGSPAPNTMASVCNTTPGATCQIAFTDGSTVHSLPAQTVDPGGATYWNWKLQDYGLTAGTWQIQAIAKQNGQTVIATDATPLVVSP